MNIKLDQRQMKLMKYGLSKQPLMIFIEESGQIVNNFININNFTYELSSTLRTIDITFKTFFALQLAYPKECLMPWMVIQKRIYDIAAESDVDIPAVYTFISDLRRAK